MPRLAHNDLSTLGKKIREKYMAMPPTPQRTIRYHKDYPDGKSFAVDRAPEGDGWVDSPDKLKGGAAGPIVNTVTLSKPADADRPVSFEELSDERLSLAYEVAFGKKPHHKAKRETIIASLKG